MVQLQPVYDYEANTQEGCFNVRSFVLDNVRSEKISIPGVIACARQSLINTLYLIIREIQYSMHEQVMIPYELF